MNDKLQEFIQINTPQILTNPQGIFSLSDLEAKKEYRFSIITRHQKWDSSPGPKGSEYVLFLEVNDETDSNGKINLSQKISQEVVGRELYSHEKSYADFLSLKMTNDLSKDELPLSMDDSLELLKEYPDLDFMFIYVSDIKTNQIVKKYYQEFITYPETVQHRKIDSDRYGFVGDLFLPKNFSNKPAKERKGFLVFGGSGGVPPFSDAHDIASRGHAALALDYFDFEESDQSKKGYISHFLYQVPLERFLEGIEYLMSLGIEAQNITMLGESRGGEGAMVFAAYVANDLGIGTIVGNRPLHYAASGVLGRNSISEGEREKSSWTYRNEQIPYMPRMNNDFNKLLLDTALEKGAAKEVDYDGKKVFELEILHGWLKWLDHNEENGGQGLIPVENYQGRLITFGGSDDQLWPAAKAIKSIAKSRKGKKDDVHLIVRDGGHVRIGNRKSTKTSSQKAFYYPGLGLMINGGKPKINAIMDVVNQWVIREAVEGGEFKEIPFEDFLVKQN